MLCTFLAVFACKFSAFLCKKSHKQIQTRNSALLHKNFLLLEILILRGLNGVYLFIKYSETLNNEYIERIHQMSYSSLSDNGML